MSTALQLVIGEAFLLLMFFGSAGWWLQGVRGLVRARQTGEIRSGIGVGRSIFRSSDAKAFNRVFFWRTVYLALSVLPLAWFAFIAFGLPIGMLLL